MMDPYRDPAKMPETTLIRETTRLYTEVIKLRKSVRRAWLWAFLWVCVCGSVVILQHMIPRAETGYPKAAATSCPACAPPCATGCRTKADLTCEDFRKLLAPPLDRDR